MRKLASISMAFILVSPVADAAVKWNDPSSSGNKVPYKFIELEGQIPLEREYELFPTNSDVLLTDTHQFEYPNCIESIKNNRKLYPYDLNTVAQLTKSVAARNINEEINFAGPQSDDQGISDKFGMTMHKAHMACLKGELAGCTSIWT